ncbi:M14 family metallopeptidase, partial [Bacteroidota bacterium]
EFTMLEEITKSEEGRSVFALTINNPKTGNELDKPGIYVDGNIHGNEIQAGEVCLYLADYLLSNYGKNDKLTKLVDKNVFYIIPSVNVDGRYHFFTDANTSSSNRGLRIPKDDDRDGLYDEDFSDDLDGDGNICRMRIKDPNGDYKTDPEDERLMVRVKPGEKGEWRTLGSEGIDNDGDGRVNEDSEGYVDGNRNWGYQWEPSYVQGGSGDFPFSGNVTKAISNFMLARPNICVSFAYHNSGGMYLRGPSTKSEGEYNRNDVEVYDFLGEHTERIVPGYRYLISWKDLYVTYGDFDNFVYNVIGSYAFVGELFMRSSESFTSTKEKDVPEESTPFFNLRNWRNRERLKYSDHVAQGELYKPWKKYNHPVYGEIEIGGWVKMSSRLPHPFMLQDLVHRNASAVIFSAEQTPEIEMEVFETKKIDDDIYRVRVRIKNSKAIPTLTYNAVKKKSHRKDILSISGNNVKVITGGKIKNVHRDDVDYKEHRPEIQFLQVPGHGLVEYQFLVSGSGKVKIDYSSLKAGKKSTTVTLK